MALKIRFLYYSKQAKMKALGEEIKKEFDLSQNYNAVDVIPPAYSCQKERLVILGISSKTDMDDVLRRFCSQLNREQASNIAVIVDGSEAVANKILATLKDAGSNVIPEVQYLSCGLFKTKLTDEEKSTLLAWIHDIIDNRLV